MIRRDSKKDDSMIQLEQLPRKNGQEIAISCNDKHHAGMKNGGNDKSANKHEVIMTSIEPYVFYGSVA